MQHKQEFYLDHNQPERLRCLPSESSSSRYGQSEGDSMMNDFKKQIEERYKISVANKLYSFPRQYNCISDIVSSSDDQVEQKQHSMNINQKFLKKQPIAHGKTMQRQPQKTSKGKKKTPIKRQHTQKGKEKQTNRSKRLRTEPDSVNYVDTLRSKMRKN